VACLDSIPLFGNVGLPSPPASGLVASFATTTGKIELWTVAVSEALGEHVGHNGPSPSPGGETVYLCYFDGDFGPPRGPEASGVPDWSRVVVEIDANGRIDLLAGGFRDSIPVIDPNTTVTPSPTTEAATDCQLALDHPELDAVVVNGGVPTLSGAFIVTLAMDDVGGRADGRTTCSATREPGQAGRRLLHRR